MNISSIKDSLKKRLSEEKYIHSVGVAETAVELAKKFGADVAKAEIAGLLHDVAKCMGFQEYIAIIKENNLDISEEEMQSKKAVHSPIGSFIAQNEFGIEDPEILSAIRWHTLGNENMTLLEKIVYLADKIEPYTRPLEYREPIVKKIEETNNLDEGILITYGYTIKSLVDRNMYINLSTIKIWNKLLIESRN